MRSYFDGITSQLFKKNSEGKDVFYPWGFFGRGYIIPNEERKKQLHKTFKRLNFVSILANIFLLRFFGLYGIIFLAFYTFGYYIAIQTITRHMPRSTEKLQFLEAYSNASDIFSFFDLFFLFLGSLGFVIAGVWAIASDKGIGVGVLAILFFGCCLGISSFMIYKKLTSRGSNS